MRAHDKPGNSNPFATALAFLGIGGLVIGLALTFSDTSDELTAVGAIVTNVGAMLFVGWLVAEAVLWRPRVTERVEP